VLSICATPIGNLQDISARLITTLTNCDLIAVEDSRHTIKLLNHLGISKPYIVIEQHKEKKAINTLISKLENGENIALVTDAGTPCISDPGALLTKACHEKNITVSPIPGPCAAVALLSASGLGDNQFYFGGFLPKKEQELLKTLHHYKQLNCPIVVFETSKRLLKTLTALRNTQTIDAICCGKELTKIYETIITGTLDDIEKKLESIPIKGEWCLAFTLKKEDSQMAHIQPQIDTLLTHFSPKEIKKIAESLNWPKNDVYTYCLTQK